MLSSRNHFWILSALMAVTACGSVLLAQAVSNDLPFTIQRVVVPSQRITKELAKVKQGTLHAMPLADLESRLEQARKTMRGRDQTPRLLRATYSAELADRVLIHGKGTWTILHSGNADAVLPIESFNLAMSKPQWGPGADALLGEFTGNSLGLLLQPKANNQNCKFDWSARGNMNSDGLNFSLRVPVCSVTTFDLILPADLWLVASNKTLLVSGPFGGGGKRLWKLRVTGQSEVDFQVRRVAETKGAARTVFSKVHTSHQLAPDRVNHDFEFHLDILHGSVNQLQFDGSAELEPYEVSLTSGEVKTWRWEPVIAKKNAPTRQLTVVFRQPVQGSIAALKVRALAPIQQSGVWTSPFMRVRDGLARSETLTIQIHPDIPFDKWDPGAFQLTNIGAAAEGGQLISLADTSSEPAPSRRPSFLLGSNGVDLLTRETNHWKLDSRGAHLSAEWNYAVQTGSLHQLSVRLPAKQPLGYQIESVEMQPADYLRSWHVTGNFLGVELKQALAPGKQATLKLLLRAPFRDVASSGRMVAYPEMVPWDSTRREGTVTIIIDPIFQARLLSSSIPLAPTIELSDKPRAGGEFFFTFRDQKVSAALRLVPQPVQVQLRGKQTVVLSEQGASASFRWEAEPLLGSPDYLDFRCSDASHSAWEIQAGSDSMQVHRWERLHVDEALPHLLTLGIAQPLGVLALERAIPVGSLWRFHLAEPLRKKSAFTLEAKISPSPTLDDWRRISLMFPSLNPWDPIAGGIADEGLTNRTGLRKWNIPLLVPVQRLNVDHAVAIESRREPIVKAEAHGLQTNDSSSANLDMAPALSLSFQADSAWPAGAAALTVWTHPDQASSGVNELCDQALLTTAAAADGRLSHHLRFRLWHWRSPTFAIGFSTGTRITAVKLQNRWLNDLDIRDHASGVVVRLPIDQSTPSVQCEIFASGSMQGGGFPGLSRIVAPKIDWPLPPTDFRARVVLDGALAPVDRTHLTRVGIPEPLDQQPASIRRFGRAWNWGRSWLSLGSDAEASAKLAAQKQALLNADLQLRAASKNNLLLADALERLALHHLAEDVPLIVDRFAFRSLGLTPKTALAAVPQGSPSTRPFWENLGLVHVACPSGALLTTARRLETFGIASGVELDPAVVQAILHGRDSSTAFVPAVLWASIPPPPTIERLREMTGFITEGAPGDVEISEWELKSAEGGGAGYLVINMPRVSMLGVIAAILGGVLLWRMHATWRRVACLRVYLVLLALGAIIVLWLPLTILDLLVLPAFTTVGVAGLWFFFGTKRPAEEPDSKPVSTLVKPGSGAVMVVLALVGLPLFGGAQPAAPRSYIVYILEAPTPTALVPAELITKLAELDRPSPIPARSAVLTAAHYVGDLKDPSAEFEAVYELFTARDNVELTIPLVGVQLQEGAKLDDDPVFPTVTESGYAVKIRHKGMHTLRLTFTARTVLAGEYVDLAFVIPKLARSEITLRIPESLQGLHSLRPGGGEERFGVSPMDNGREWHAELGYDRGVHLRWSGAKNGELTKGTEVTEMHYWDLRPGQLSLSSSLNYTIGKGNLSQLIVFMPDRLQVRGVNVQAGVANPIKNWHLVGKGGQRRLIVDLVQPIGSQVLLQLDLAPQLALHAKQLALPLPAAAQARSVLAHVAYQLDATEVRRSAQNLSVENASAEEFALTWRKQHNQAISVSRAFRFQRKNSQAGLQLEILPTERDVRMQIDWKLDLHHADLSGKFTLSSPTESIIEQDFKIPTNVQIANVVGADVATWQMRDGSLQVWFRRPCKHTEIEIVGWQRQQKLAPTAEQSRFVVPSIHPLDVRLNGSTLRVQPADGLIVQHGNLQHLERTGVGAGTYTILDPRYSAEFRVRAEPAVAEAQSLIRIQPTERGIELWCAIRLTTDRGKLPPLSLRVRNWPEATLDLTASGAAILPRKNRMESDRHFDITFADGLPRDVHIVLHGHTHAANPKSVMLPDLELTGIPFRARFVLWKDLDIVDVESRKKIADGSTTPPSIPFALPTGSSLTRPSWKYAQLQGRANAVLPVSAAFPKVHLIACSEQLLQSGSGVWTHEVDFWIQASEPAGVRIGFAAPLQNMSMFVEKELRVSQPIAGNEYLLPLPTRAQPQHVKLRFAYRDEDAASPRTDFPLLAGVSVATDTRIAWIPPGSTTGPVDWRGRPSLVERLLDRSARYIRLSSASVGVSTPVAQDTVKFLIEQQKPFYASVWQADYLLKALKVIQPNADLSAWQDRLQRLRERNRQLAKEHGFERERASAENERPTAAGNLFAVGDLAVGLPFVIPAAATALPLLPASTADSGVNSAGSRVIAAAGLLLFLMTYFRPVLALLRALLPELAMATLIALIAFAGLGVLGVVGVVALFCVRIAWLWMLIRGWLHTVSPAQTDQRSTTSKPSI